MAAGKRTRAMTAREFTVILEDLRSKFSVFGEALQGLREEMGRRFDEVDHRFERIERRLDGHDKRFDDHDKRLVRVETGLELVKTAVLENTREIKALRVDVQHFAASRPDREEVVAIARRVMREGG